MHKLFFISTSISKTLIRSLRMLILAEKPSDWFEILLDRGRRLSLRHDTIQENSFDF